MHGAGRQTGRSGQIADPEFRRTGVEAPEDRHGAVDGLDRPALGSVRLFLHGEIVSRDAGTRAGNSKPGPGSVRASGRADQPRTARASISTRLSGSGRPVNTVVRDGSTPLGVRVDMNSPYASFIAAKSSRLVR